MSTLLGIPDKRIEKAETIFSTNKIGGKPDWILEGCQNPACSICKQVMSLAVQLYCPLDGSPFHRSIYLFTCINRQCWNKQGSWKAVRSQLQDKSFAKTKKTVPERVEDWGAGADDWGTDVNDWGDTGDDWGTDANDWGESASEDVSECLGKMDSTPTATNEEEDQTSSGGSSLQNDPINVDCLNMENMHLEDSEDRVLPETDAMVTEQDVNQMMSLLVTKNNKSSTDSTIEQTKILNQVTKSDDHLHLEAYFLNVIEEVLTEESDDWHIKKMLKDYQKREGVNLEEMVYQQDSYGKGGSAMGGEKYEKEDIVHGDRHFYKFTKRIAAYPQQCVRYAWDGNPVFISAPDSRLMSSKVCVNCGKKCVYELQLMPALVNLLHVNDKPEPTTEFGTVILYSCSTSCWDDGDLYREETVYLQPDPDNHLFRV